ncbi:hypothetical protein SISNIDRAFT_451357 [Sistotremastrum niveocremeum HHB9708]|uniref:Uncharacterized protein n=1 Tax=Sistotremastrum niveocremeum HHB9708 TaxID=1314777 RepID=A0A164X927_9AGAM|nr:hypothetical protein SISNIDRAFT_451357 [Sistotremastrum niveocremeum HHB9708]
MLLALTLCFLASLSGFVLGHPTSVARNGVTYSHPLHDGKPAKIPSQLTLISVDKRQPSPFELVPRTLTLPATGTISVTFRSGSLIGYVASTLTSDHTFALTLSSSSAAHVTVSSTTGFIDLVVASEPYGYVGAALGFQGSDFVSGSPSYAFMTPVPQSSSPATGNAIGSQGESQIWNIDSTTLELTASWRSGTSSSPLITFYDESYGDLDFTADLTAFTDEYSDRVIQVRLWFNPA